MNLCVRGYRQSERHDRRTSRCSSTLVTENRDHFACLSRFGAKRALDSLREKIEAGTAPTLQPHFAQVGTCGYGAGRLQTIVEAQSGFPTKADTNPPPKDSNPDVPMLTLPISALLILALAFVTVVPSVALDRDKCYSSCKARCVAKYDCEGRHPGPNCFTNFNKCETSCWRMCRM